MPRPPRVPIALAWLVAVLLPLAVLVPSGATAATGPNLVRNPSFESGKAGWSAQNGALRVLRTRKAPKGRSVAVARGRQGRFFAISDRGKTSSRARPGARYAATVYVRAHGRASIGAPVSLKILERARNGRLIRIWRRKTRARQTFNRVMVVAKAGRRGRSLDVQMSVGRRKRGGAVVQLDAVTLGRLLPVRRTTSPSPSVPESPVPPGGEPTTGRPTKPDEGPGRASPKGGAPMLAESAPTGSGSESPSGIATTYDGSPPFAPTSPFNARLPANARLDPESDSKASAILGRGDPSISYTSWNPSVYQGREGDPVVEIRLRNQGRWGDNPLHGKRIRIPAGAEPPDDTSSPDNHMSIVDQGWSHSLWRAEGIRNGVLWATWGGMAPLASDGSNIPGSSGGRASGINQIAGLITPRDLQAGEIGHALAVGVYGTQVSRGFVPPATGSDGTASPSSRTIKEGQRLRLPADIDLNRVRASDPRNQAFARMIAKALRDYGAVVVDRSGSALTFYMTHPISWTSIGLANPWPSAAGPLSSWGSYNNIVRDTGIPWSRLQVISEDHE